MSAWKWISEGYLSNNSEGMLMASQSQAIQNGFMKVNINKVIILLLCRMCREMRLSAILYINASAWPGHENKKLKHVKDALLFPKKL